MARDPLTDRGRNSSVCATPEIDQKELRMLLRQEYIGRRLPLLLILIIVSLLALPALAENAKLASGTWTKKSQSAAGSWKIYQKDGQIKMMVSDDFKTRKAPDLKIFLSPWTAAEAKNKNATTGSLFVAELPKFKGGFEVALPAGTDLSQYKSVLIHCEKYTKLWVASDLH